MFGGSFPLPASAERAVEHSSHSSHSQKLGRAAEHLVDGRDAFVDRASNFRVRMLLKSAVTDSSQEQTISETAVTNMIKLTNSAE